jgi:hypothetical protein
VSCLEQGGPSARQRQQPQRLFEQGRDLRGSDDHQRPCPADGDLEEIDAINWYGKI